VFLLFVYTVPVINRYDITRVGQWLLAESLQISATAFIWLSNK